MCYSLGRELGLVFHVYLLNKKKLGFYSIFVMRSLIFIYKYYFTAFFWRCGRNDGYQTIIDFSNVAQFTLWIFQYIFTCFIFYKHKTQKYERFESNIFVDVEISGCFYHDLHHYWIRYGYHYHYHLTVK